MTTRQWVIVAVLVGAAGLGILTFTRDNNVFGQTSTGTARLPVEKDFPSLAGATGWINSPPLTADGLRGKVVLVDFWTFTCVNWLRTLPYVRAWADKYKDAGLVVIGAHTPEFGLEKDVDNIRQAIAEMRVDYPVAIDSNFGVWNAFRNNAWPAMYIVDAEGRVRYHHLGEGGYEEAERAIQALLADAGAANVPRDLVAVDPQGTEVAADWDHLQSPETYVGHDRSGTFASPGGQALGQKRTYSAPERLTLNRWALSGAWTVGAEAIVSNEAGAGIAYEFHARDVNLVTGPATRGGTIRFRVLVDGKPPGDAHGTDVDADGNGTLTGQRLYQLVRVPGAIADRRFEIQFLDPGAQALSFTFG